MKRQRKRDWFPVQAGMMGALGAALACLVCIVVLSRAKDMQVPGADYILMFLVFALSSIYGAIVAASYRRRLRSIPELAQKLGSLQAGPGARDSLVEKGASAIPSLLAALRGPGGSAEDWNGTYARIHAAQGLGALRALDATGDLFDLLGDRSPNVRAAAVEALGEIGEPRAVTAIIPLLTDTEGIRRYARNALAKLGEDTLARHLLKAVHDCDDRLPFIRNDYRDAVVAMFISGAQRSRVDRVVCIQRLAELKAIEALPMLRVIASPLNDHLPSKRAARAALLQLEPLTGLPRTVEAAATDTSTLPVPAQPTVARDGLPRAVARESET